MMTRTLSWLLIPALFSAGPVASSRARDGQVTALSLSSSGGTARFTVSIAGGATVRDFQLRSPERLILEVSPATKGDLARYDGLRRGIVSEVRVTQFDSATVRIVLEFDRMPTFTVDKGTPGLVTVAYTDGPFQSWQSGIDGEKLVARSASVMAPAAGESTPPATEASFAPLVPQQQGGLLNVTFNKSPIADVLDIFANMAGVSIVPGAKVTGDVSMTIRNQTWQHAFDALLAQQGLAATIMPGGIIRVDAPGELAKLDSIEILKTEVVRLNFAKAGEMSKILVGMLTKNRGSVMPDTSNNALIVTDTRTKLPGILDFVKSLDLRPATVAIQARLIFVDRTNLEQLGVKYDIGNNNQFFNKLIQRTDPLTGQPYNPNVNVVNLGGNAISAISNADALISGSALDLVFSTAIGGFSVTSFLSALERVELTDVEAVPQVNVISNQKATILSGEETPIRVIDASSFGQINTAPRASVQLKTTGIQLTTTPSVTADRHIVMDLDVERSSIQQLSASDLGYNFPKQHSTSRLLVADGEVAVMSGLVVTSVTRNRQSIPLLGSLPFIGKLFSFTTDQENRKDLIILVTPRILDDPDRQN